MKVSSSNPTLKKGGGEKTMRLSRRSPLCITFSASLLILCLEEMWGKKKKPCGEKINFLAAGNFLQARFFEGRVFSSFSHFSRAMGEEVSSESDAQRWASWKSHRFFSLSFFQSWIWRWDFHGANQNASSSDQAQGLTYFFIALNELGKRRKSPVLRVGARGKIALKYIEPNFSELGLENRARK